ncbi:hypothetical protein G9A89_003229 [Geosiphon pyriformis]|nr:hypothetical protein G9A89_003229 [Geosiphon pyriformis]
MRKAVSLAEKKEIIVNNNVRKQGLYSDWAVVIKKIPMNTPKDMIITTVSEFEIIKSIKIQWLFLIGKDSICVAIAVKDCDTWAFRDQFKTLLFTLSVGTTTHNLGILLNGAEGKTCIINCLLKTGNRFHCAVVGFGFVEELESAFLTEPIFSGVCLSWARLDLVWCGKCGRFGYSALECDVSVLARLYAKKNVPISHPVAFGSKSWAQVVSNASYSGGFPFSSGFLSDDMPLFLGPSKCSLEILLNQVSVILKKLSFVELVLLASPSCASLLAVFVPLASVVDSDMALDNVLASVDPLFFGGGESAAVLSSSGSKIFTSKMGVLESKMSALEASFSSILMATCNVRGINIPAKQEDVIANKFDGVRIFSLGLNKGFYGAGVVIIMADSLAYHVTKIKEDKLLVFVIGLYADVSSGTHFGQASEVNSVIAKAINSSCFVVLGKNFNKNRSGKSVSFKFCLGWVCNSRRVKKTIDFIFVSKSLASAVAGYKVSSISDFFDTDHHAVSVSIGLGGFLDGHLNSLHKQANKDCWKDCSSAKLLAVFGEFSDALAHADMDGMWVFLEKVLVDSADRIFSRHWFSEFQCFRNKLSSRFFRLELLVVKVVKGLELGDLQRVNQLINVWAKLNSGKAAMIANMIQIGGRSSDVLRQLSLFWKKYRKSKMYESKLAEEASVWKAIEYCMEKFCSDKGVMIRSVLDWSFHKMVLNHLVVGDDLVLEPDMYALLDYVKDDTFADVMHLIDMSKLLLVVNNLPDDKATGLSDIPNELWKHCNDIVLKCLLGLLNSKFGVLQGDNFLVLKDTSMQSLVFAIGSVVEDALEKNREVWLVLQDMCKAYDSVGWHNLRNILDIASGFFALNDISINNEKTVVIPINQGVKVVFLCISGLPISIAKKGKAHHYLEIFLSTNELSKPSLAKAHSDICFFSNVVLRKAITDKQFLYLVSAILQPIVSYHTQFSFDVMLRKSFKSKAGLAHDFPTEALCHSFLYGLKSFEQVQSEGKLAALISFSNFFGILGCLFEHRFLDLQVLEWSLLNPLQFSVRLCVSSVNNFLAGVVRIFLCNELSLVNNLPNAFYSSGYFPVSSILGSSLFFNSVYSLKWFGVAFGNKLFDKKGCGSASHWFRVVFEFLCGRGTFLAASVGFTCFSGLSVLDTKKFSVVQDGLHRIWSGFFEAFMDDSVRNYGHADVASRAAAYFPALDLSIGIRVLRLLSFTMAELQAIALALECVPSSCTVVLHSDNQTAIDACISEMSLSVPDFHSSCWLERHRIFNLGLFCVMVHGNVRIDAAARDAAFSQFFLSIGVHKHFLVAENTPVFSNAHYFWNGQFYASYFV